MKTINKYHFPFQTFNLSLFLIFLAIIQSCSPDKKKDQFIEIVTEVMDFQSVDTIPSGWNTFKYINKSNETHFFLLDKYPAGKTLEDAVKEVIPPFQNGMDLINEGNDEEGFAEFNKLPAWFFEVVFSGGSGLVSPKNSSLTTIKLEPGYYIMECYVKMANGIFHNAMGMTKAIVVNTQDSGNLPPKATVEINISSTEGISFENSIPKGIQVFSVHFKDQITHENFVGHDLNLVKLNDNANLDALEGWMNWADPKGLITPSPDGITFLGGVNDMPAGSTGYFEINLEPGNYAFVSEVPNASGKNMLKTFTVKD
jgi:hypothetical protein